MPTLTEILEDPGHNGVYRLIDAMPDGRGSGATSAAGQQPAPSLADRPDVRRLDARQCPDKDAFLQAIGHALSFPDYYGMNWDALEECLFDMSWWAGPIIVLIAHADALDRDALATLLDIWSGAAATWAAAGRVCVLLLDGAGEVSDVPAIEV